ncbi:MAG: O-antigen ligase family protein [Chitinophagales bacterium]
MNESRNNPVIGDWRKSILLISMMAMITGLLFSRIILSFALIVFVVISLFHRNILLQLKVFFSSPLLWSMSLLFLIPFISGLWSGDLSQWSGILRIKLPFLLLPVSFAGIESFNFKDWERIAFSFLILMAIGTGWSLWHYFQNPDLIHAAYLRAGTIETPLENDHVRFSLLVAIAILTAIFLLTQKKGNYKKTILILLLVMTLVFILYLHVLAVRTGLFCFYMGVFVFLISLLWRKKNKMRYSLLLGLMLLFPVISYFILPTFKNRVSYLKYDLSLVQKNILVQGSNDGDRFFSIKAGWRLLHQNPWAGVGFGDIKKETDRFYETNYPHAMMADRILPSSEWMMYGAGAGWPGVILFSFAMLVPFFVRRWRRNIFWLLLNLFLASSYLFDIGLEGQYGIFMHAFILLWWYKWLQLQE